MLWAWKFCRYSRIVGITTVVTSDVDCTSKVASKYGIRYNRTYNKRELSLSILWKLITSHFACKLVTCVRSLMSTQITLSAFDYARGSTSKPFMNRPWLFTSPRVNRVNGFRNDPRALDMKSNDEILFMNRFMAVIERIHCESIIFRKRIILVN